MSRWSDFKASVARGAAAADEYAHRAIEKSTLSDEARVNWTASLLAIREMHYPSGRWATAAKEGGGITITRAETQVPRMSGKRVPAFLRKMRGDGPLWLAKEAHDAGMLTDKQLDAVTYDTVYWVAGYDKPTKPGGRKRPRLIKLADDFGDFKSHVNDELDRLKLAKPNTDELDRFLGVALAIAAAGAAVAVTILAPVAAPAAVPAILSLGGIGSDMLFNASDDVETKFKAQSDAAGAKGVEVEGSDVVRGLGKAALSSADAYYQGARSADELLDAAASGYVSGSQTPAPVAPAPPAVVESPALTWAKSPTGMIIIGGAAIVLLVVATRR